MIDVTLFVLYIGLPVGLLLLALVCGQLIERAHLRALTKAEQRYRPLLLTNLKQPPPGYEPAEGWLCVGSVVVGTDHFKRFVSRLKTLIGGRLGSLESVLERARREALVRLLAEAKRHGADLICNVRIETATIGNAHGDQNTLSSAEVVAYGTAVRRREDPPYRS